MKHLTRITIMLLVSAGMLLAACASPTPVPTAQPTALPVQPTAVPTKAPPSAPTAVPTSAPPQPTAVPTAVSPARPSGEIWPQVEKSGVLRIATSADYAPFVYYGKDFKIDGYDIALINEIAKKLNLKVEVNDFAFEGLGGAIANGQADVAIGAISYTPERAELVDFSDVYYASSDGTLSRPDFTLEAKTPQALGNYRLAVQKGSVYETEAKAKLIEPGYMASRNLLVYSDIGKAVDDLKAKRVDLVWLDLLPAQNFAKDGSVKLLAKDLRQQLYVIGMPKGASVLQSKINDALTQLQNDGTLAKLAQQYLKLTSDQIAPLPPTPPQPVTPPPTPVPPACIDGAQWAADLSYDDQNMTNPPIMQPGQSFTKGWRLLNTGTCSWTTSFKLAYASGNVPAAQMGGAAHCRYARSKAWRDL